MKKLILFIEDFVTLMSKSIAFIVFNSLSLLALIISIVISFLNRDPASVAIVEFANRHPVIMSSIMVFITLNFIIWLSGFIINKLRLKTMRRIESFALCKNTNELTLADLRFEKVKSGEKKDFKDGTRPFFEKSYIHREFVWDKSDYDPEADEGRKFTEKALRKKLREGGGRGLLMVDTFNAGKTLAMLNILIGLKDYVVISPAAKKPVPDRNAFSFLKNRKVIILLDDIDQLARENYDIISFAKLTGEATGGNYAVAATCRKGANYSLLLESAGNTVVRFCEDYLQKYRLVPMTVSQREELSKKVGLEWDETQERNYPLPGDITQYLQYENMTAQYENLDPHGKRLLQAMKLLDSVGIPQAVVRIQHILENVFGCGSDRVSLEKDLCELEKRYFMLEPLSEGKVKPHPGFLIKIVKYPEDLLSEDDRFEKTAQSMEKSLDQEGLEYLSRYYSHQIDFERSQRLFELILKINPDNAYAHYGLGYNYARSDQIEKALEENSKAIELNPEFADAWNNRCYILGRKGDFPEALTAVENALALRPEFSDAYVNKAIILGLMRRLPDAITALNNALEYDSNNAYAYLRLGMALSQQGYYDTALQAFDKAIVIRRKYDGAYSNKGIVYAKMNDYEKAVAEYDKAILINGKKPSYYHLKSIALVKLSRLKEAISEIDKAIKLNPDFAELYAFRSEIYHELGSGHEEAAKNDWNKAVSLGYQVDFRRFMRAISLARNGKLADAEKEFNTMIYLYPFEAELYVNRAKTVIRTKGRLNDAISDYKKAIDLDPSNIMSYCQLARAYTTDSKHELALDIIKKALELNPAMPDAICEHAAILANLGDFGRALEVIDGAKDVLANNAFAHYTRGYILTKFGKEKRGDALKEYEEAIRLKPNYAEAFKESGFLLGQLYRDNEALKAYSAAIEIRHDYPDALYGKARTLCFIARKNPKISKDSYLSEAMGLLEMAVKLDKKKTVKEIARQNPEIFKQLRESIVYGDRFKALLNV